MIVAERQKNYFLARDLFNKRSDFLPLKDEGLDVISSFAIPFLCKSDEIKSAMLEKCAALEIETRPLIAGSIAVQPFMAKADWDHSGLDNASFIHANYFYIGNHEAFKDAEYSSLQALLG